eukprot:3632826-Pyramimonas_sp.AAC.1
MTCLAIDSLAAGPLFDPADEVGMVGGVAPEGLEEIRFYLCDQVLVVTGKPTWDEFETGVGLPCSPIEVAP